MKRQQSMMMGGWVLASLLGAFLLASAGCEAGSDDPSSQASADMSRVLERVGARVGTPAPNFQLWDINGNPITLSEYRGRVVLVNFWATWCGPCRVEMPAMDRLYQQFNHKDFEILAVSTDPQGVAVTRPFKESLGLTFPILHDSDFRVGVAYGARTLPITFLVDRQGIIRHRIFGARDWGSQEARQLIQTLLKTS